MALLSSYWARQAGVPGRTRWRYRPRARQDRPPCRAEITGCTATDMEWEMLYIQQMALGSRRTLLN